MKIAFCILTMLSLVNFVGSAKAEEYKQARAKALALMAMENQLAQASKSPHNWCHCGNCESIADAKALALALIDKECGCKKDECPCMPDQCPDCDGSSTWKKHPGEPHRRYRYDGAALLLGGYDIPGKYYRAYCHDTDIWGLKMKCPFPLPEDAVQEKASAPTRYIQCNGTSCTISSTPFAGGCSGGNCGTTFRRR